MIRNFKTFHSTRERKKNQCLKLRALVCEHLTMNNYVLTDVREVGGRLFELFQTQLTI